jgi:hypothetical protein
MRKKISFVEWINTVGATNVAKRLGVSARVVHYWRIGHCSPRVDQIRAIRKLSNGRLTYEAIIDGEQP